MMQFTLKKGKIIFVSTDDSKNLLKFLKEELPHLEQDKDNMDDASHTDSQHKDIELQTSNWNINQSFLFLALILNLFKINSSAFTHHIKYYNLLLNESVHTFGTLVGEFECNNSTNWNAARCAENNVMFGELRLAFFFFFWFLRIELHFNFLNCSIQTLLLEYSNFFWAAQLLMRFLLWCCHCDITHNKWLTFLDGF